jgi:hypothetical protein
MLKFGYEYTIHSNDGENYLGSGQLQAEIRAELESDRG